MAPKDMFPLASEVAVIGLPSSSLSTTPEVFVRVAIAPLAGTVKFVKLESPLPCIVTALRTNPHCEASGAAIVSEPEVIE